MLTADMLLHGRDWGLATSMTDEVSLLPVLIVQAGPMQGASFRLRGDTWVIGRDEALDILIEDVQVSRRHAVIERTGGRLMLADAGSTNGTWLNDRRLTESTELHDGDRIRVGGVELRFYDTASASTERVGAAIHALARPRPPTTTEADAAGASAGVLREPTQVMDAGRRSGRAWLILAAILLLLLVVAGSVWAFVIR